MWESAWLTTVAHVYEYYRIKRFVLRYEPVVSTATSGSLIAGFDYDPSNELATTVGDVRNLPYASTNAVYIPRVFSFEPSRGVDMWRKVPVAGTDSAERSLYYSGAFAWCFSGASTTTYGQVWAEYTVEFHTPTRRLVDPDSVEYVSPAAATTQPVMTIGHDRVGQPLPGHWSGGLDQHTSVFTFDQPWMGEVELDYNVPTAPTGSRPGEYFYHTGKSFTPSWRVLDNSKEGKMHSAAYVEMLKGDTINLVESAAAEAVPRAVDWLFKKAGAAVKWLAKKFLPVLSTLSEPAADPSNCLSFILRDPTGTWPVELGDAASVHFNGMVEATVAVRVTGTGINNLSITGEGGLVGLKVFGDASDRIFLLSLSMLEGDTLKLSVILGEGGSVTSCRVVATPRSRLEELIFLGE